MRTPRYAVALGAAALSSLLVLTPGAAGLPAAPAAPDRDPRPQHSSDGVVGEIAPDVPPAARQQVTSRTLRSWQVAPGVRARVWRRTDARGAVRLHLLRVDAAQPGVRLDHASRDVVRKRSRLTRILGADDSVVAGVNGDFFDISRTGAPLGTGLDRQDGLRHGRTRYWNETFSVSREGRARVGTVPMRASLRQHPDVEVTNLDAPWVMPGGIGVYTRAFGRLPGYAVTQGQRDDLRVVQVRRGRVVSRSRRLPEPGRVRGELLVGRGPGAADLRTLRVGDPVTVDASLPGDRAMAITGNVVLLSRGRVRVTDDGEMHPRTAVGVDTDTGEVLLLAVDGRQEDSRGLTMVELARTMRDLGAEQALNLDGGGSTTMVARRPSGADRVVNSPSDGGQRPVPNGIEVSYRAPAG